MLIILYINYINKIQRYQSKLTNTMYLSERKKYNYLQTSSQTYQPTRSRRQQIPLQPRSSLNHQNITPIQTLQLKPQIQSLPQKFLSLTSKLGSGLEDNSKRIFELQNVNKRLLESTTEQFRKFQGDILRVQGILKVKEEAVCRLQDQNKKLREDKSDLIDALKDKELIIREYQAKFKQIMKERQNKENTKTQQIYSQTTKSSQNKQTTQTQLIHTFPQNPTLNPTYTSINQQYKILQQQLVTQKQKYKQQKQKSQKLTEQVYKLKQELFEASSELQVVKQQFQSYKILYQIQAIKNT